MLAVAVEFSAVSVGAQKSFQPIASMLALAITNDRGRAASNAAIEYGELRITERSRTAPIEAINSIAAVDRFSYVKIILDTHERRARILEWPRTPIGHAPISYGALTLSVGTFSTGHQAVCTISC